MSASEKRSLRERLRPKERKPAVRWLLTVLLLAAAVLGLHMLLQMIGTLDFSRGRFSSYLHVPKIYLLNLLPVALLVAFTYFATNRAWLGFLIPSVLLFLMDFVNYFKVTLRGDPFVAEDFLTQAGKGEICFVENISAASAAERVEQVYLFHWNRAYPGDRFFDLPLEDGWELTLEEEFSGSSHENITLEVYERA